VRYKNASHEAMTNLRLEIENMVTDAVERALSRSGEITFSRIGADGHDDVTVADDKRDAWATATDVLGEAKRSGRIYSPAGILFRKPKKDETAHVLRAKDCGGVGAELIVPDGGTGAANHLPDWYSDKAGVYVDDQVVRIEAKNDDVEVQSGDGKIVNIQAGDKGIARQDDAIHAGWLLVTPGVPPATTTVVAYQPYGPVPPVPVPPQIVIALTGKITAASTKAKCG
jgi:hypothetical protein